MAQPTNRSVVSHCSPRLRARGLASRFLCSSVGLLGGTAVALAQTAAPSDAALPLLATAPAAAKTDAGPPPSLWERPNLLGDVGGLRPWLDQKGLSLTLTENSEVLANASGGERRQAVYEGQTEVSLALDTAKLFGLAGGTFNISMVQVHGRGLSANALDSNLQTVSGLEAERGTLLFELWYEQSLFDQAIKFRAGQLAAEQDFIISQNAALFVNATFGWPTLAAADLPSGGPAAPLATPAIRVKWAPRDNLTMLIAAFNGDPTGPGVGSAQLRDASGTDFRLHDDVLALGEVQFAINVGPKASGLPGTYKLGMYYHSGYFADQHYAIDGRSLANPAGAGLPARVRGNYSFYAVADQTLIQSKSGRTLSIFARIMGAPGEHNLIDLDASAGLTLKAPLAERESDIAGVAFGMVHVSAAAAALDADTARFSDVAYRVRSSEMVVETTYQATITPWCQVQPSIQYIIRPNGGVPNPLALRESLANASVFTLRTTVTF